MYIYNYMHIWRAAPNVKNLPANNHAFKPPSDNGGNDAGESWMVTCITQYLQAAVTLGYPRAS